jgi:urease accessory protein UreE
VGWSAVVLDGGCLLSKPDGADFNLAVIPEDSEVERKGEFDQNYMIQLFTLGYNLGNRGYPCMKYPPGLQRAVEPEGKISLRK